MLCRLSFFRRTIRGFLFLELLHKLVVLRQWWRKLLDEVYDIKGKTFVVAVTCRKRACHTSIRLMRVLPAFLNTAFSRVNMHTLPYRFKFSIRTLGDFCARFCASAFYLPDYLLFRLPYDSTHSSRRSVRLDTLLP
ncbi:hypothetical protein ALQ30_200718 [Pseudomonas syringae pv. persicae]|uniref:Uncharacterized protein n=1 Tax=Pseudomonas syringae pv. persicae TaxID=237306 RepID=A0A3M3ZIG7_9PSED|nr:hypothetical protein ALQ30_200718 [Pseudomonas syringae pv. persicae]